MSSPTEKELGVLGLFRERVADVVEELPLHFRTDILMLTWLRARNLNVSQAEEMLRKSIEWRKLHDIYTLYEWSPPERYLTDYSFEISGYTEEGYPVVVVPLGRWDIRDAVERGEKELYLKFINYMFSTMMNICVQRSVLPHKVVSQFVCIVDMEGFAMRQVTLMGAVDTVLEAARRFEANFPESLKQCFVINAPRIFPMLFALVKPILNANTVAKIQIYGASPKKWKEALKKGIPGLEYPQKYGGTKQSSNSNTNRQNIPSNPSVDGNDEELIAVTVPAGDKFELIFDITSTGITLSWTFKTEDYDIGFSVLRDDLVLRPMAKYDSHLENKEGSLVCEATGRYTLIFDNTYSRLRSKRLHYIVTVNSDSVDEEDDDEDECTSL